MDNDHAQHYGMQYLEIMKVIDPGRYMLVHTVVATVIWLQQPGLRVDIC